MTGQDKLGDIVYSQTMSSGMKTHASGLGFILSKVS